MKRKNWVIDINMVLGFISNKLLTSGWHTVYPIMHQRLGASNLTRVALKFRRSCN